MSIGGFEQPSDDPESLDVLLQLTLPVVLILAFLVITEVGTLQQQLASLEQDVQRTPTGGLREDLERSVLELQHQLLLKATDEVAAEKRREIGLESYALVRPSVADVRRGRISEPFRRTSVLLGELFNGGRREATRDRLIEAVLERFQVLAREVAASSAWLGPERMRALLRPTRENLAYMRTKLDGHLKDMRARGEAVQAGLLREWLSAAEPVESEEGAKRGKELWVKLQGGDIVFARAFENLGVEMLLGRLAEEDLPVLDSLRAKALGSGETSL